MIHLFADWLRLASQVGSSIVHAATAQMRYKGPAPRACTAFEMQGFEGSCVQATGCVQWGLPPVSFSSPRHLHVGHWWRELLRRNGHSACGDEFVVN